ncbi:AtpZ/AtpI family protein [Bdellovibrio sp. HCB290]|uniref:AtpZ/AtpI family protein n=1 Tax=Bdellovibrio sp. HCB290 TaxID=3394356 RepID=UPI0039B526E1
MRKYIIFASIGFELVGLIIGCFYLGELLDTKYQTKGMAFVGLSLAALVGWLVRVIWLLKRMEAQEEKENAKKNLGK